MVYSNCKYCVLSSLIPCSLWYFNYTFFQEKIQEIIELESLKLEWLVSHITANRLLGSTSNHARKVHINREENLGLSIY